MGRPADQGTPDLLPTASVRDASKLPTTEATAETAPQRYVLPKNLSAALKHLSDDELDLIHAATLEEMKRRGRTPQGVGTGSPARPDLTKSTVTPTEKRRQLNRRSPIDPWSSKCRSVSIQGRHNAITDCPRVRDFPIECAEGFGVG